MTTLDDVRVQNEAWELRQGWSIGARVLRDQSVRQCYSAGNATLAELAKATGLSKQRIHVIVREGEE